MFLEDFLDAGDLRDCPVPKVKWVAELWQAAGANSFEGMI